MSTLLRLLVVVATLFAAIPLEAWGVPDRPCLQSEQDSGHDDEPCDDQSPGCATCFCCHLRAAPAPTAAPVALVLGTSAQLVSEPRSFVPQPAAGGIFHPPRA